MIVSQHKAQGCVVWLAHRTSAPRVLLSNISLLPLSISCWETYSEEAELDRGDRKSSDQSLMSRNFQTLRMTLGFGWWVLFFFLVFSPPPYLRIRSYILESLFHNGRCRRETCLTGIGFRSTRDATPQLLKTRLLRIMDTPLLTLWVTVKQDTTSYRRLNLNELQLLCRSARRTTRRINESKGERNHFFLCNSLGGSILWMDKVNSPSE